MPQDKRPIEEPIATKPERGFFDWLKPKWVRELKYCENCKYSHSEAFLCLVDPE